MSNVYLFIRCSQIKQFLKIHGRVLHNTKLSSSSNGSDDDKVQKLAEKKQKSNEALKKLNNLLKTMIQEEVITDKKLELAKPSEKHKKKTEKEEKKPIETPELQMTNAVKDVAKSLGGDVKQTESELIKKLLSTQDKSATDLLDIVKGMKVDNEKSASEQSKAHQVRQILHSRRGARPLYERKRMPIPRSSDLPIEKIDLFGSKPLEIFTDNENAFNEGVENKTWNSMYQRDLKLAITHPPSNYFQQMILWTEQGKVWKFPIDNEQGLEEEKKIYFTEHVFLEKHLEPWCPPKGPLRHFMELVCVGLSKNPYLTAEAKKGHIEWFKNYFEDKKQLLKEVGAIQEVDSGTRKNAPKQIQ